MSNIVIPTQDHQVKAFEQASSSSKKQGSSSAEDESKQNDKKGNDSQHIVLPTQDHQVKLFEKGGNVSNIVIPNDEQLKAFETENTKLTKKEAEKNSEFSHTQFTTSVFNLLTSSGNSIFSKYTRQFDDLAKKLDSETAQLIILTPTDAAIESLSLKPWQFPNEVTTTNDSKDQVSNANIRNFLESHIIDSSSDFKKVAEGKGVDLKTLNDEKLELVNTNDSFKIVIGGKEVAEVVETQIVGNGALLTIDHPLTWPGK